MQRGRAHPAFVVHLAKRLVCAVICLTTACCGAAPAATSDPDYLDLEGISRQPLDPRAKAASVLFFYWHDCPVSNGYAPAMNRLCASYTNFAFYIVQVDPDLNVAAAKEHARQYGLRPPVLLDPQHRLVKQVGATVTPQAIVVAKDGQVLYRGRIDNRYSAVGKKSEVATQHDLRDALDAIAAGRPPKQKETKAFGCVIQSK